MDLRLLRLLAILLGDAGLVLLVLTFVLRLGLNSIVNLVAIPLIMASLVLWFKWSALKTKKAKSDWNEPHSASLLLLIGRKARLGFRNAFQLG